jgi:hypothetical protein
MFEPLDNPRGWRYVGDVVVCPVCARRSVYSRGEDRYFHSDGSANVRCWVAISSGQLAPRPMLVGGDGDEHQAAGDGPGRAA